jgi:tellurite resistance protein TehA-like permease
MNQPVRQVIVLAGVIIALTLGAMLLLLSTFGSPAPLPPRTAAPTQAAVSPTPSLEASTLQTPAENGVIALILGGVSLLLVAMLSRSLLRAQRPSQEL